MILLFIILILIIIIYLFQKKKYLCDAFTGTIKNDNLIYTSEKIIYNIYKMIYIVTYLLDKYNIIYWIEGGTLLGAIRHKGIIPWDEDADIQILDNDEEKLRLLTFELEKYKYSIINTWFGLKIFPNDGITIKGHSWKYPSLDIFVMVDKWENNKRKLKYKYKRAEKEFGKCQHSYDDVFPVKKYKFGSYYLNGPNKPYVYLKSCYGPDWNDVAYMQYDHEHEKNYKNKIKIMLTDDDRVPATPFYSVAQ